MRAGRDERASERKGVIRGQRQVRSSWIRLEQTREHKESRKMSERGSTTNLDVGFGGGFRFPFPLGGRGGLVGDKVVLVVVLLLDPTFSRIRQRL